MMYSQYDLVSIAKGALTIFAAGVATTFSNPFDLVRIRMQTMPQLVDHGLLETSYEGVIDCVKRIKHEEGIGAFWKGNGCNLLRFYASETINFCSKETMRSNINRLAISEKLPLMSNILSGVVGSWLTLGLLYPIEHARNMLSNNTSSHSKSILQSLLSTIQTKGVKQLYKGSLISFIGVSIFRGTYFGVFDTFKHNKSKIQKFSLAYFSSLLAILFTYPSDTIRRRILFSSSKSIQKIKYSGFLDCSMKVYQNQGLRSFYRGFPIIFFQSLSASCVLFSYDQIATDLKKNRFQF